jgi:hypothetical protein
MGTEALRDHWPEILTGVAERSKRTKAKPADSVRLATPRRRRPIPAP